MLKGVPISGGRKVDVKFNHGLRGWNSGEPDGEWHRETYVWLLIDNGDATWMMTERARLNPIDHYDRNKGRKIALAKVLKYCQDERVLETCQLLDRTDRKVIWAAYFAARGGKHE